MNVREQGPGGLLMLFASGATLFHLERVFADVQHIEQGGVLMAGLFSASIAFLLLGLFKSPWMRNICGFLLASGLLVGMTVVHVHNLGRGYRSSEMGLTYIAANMIIDGRHPYDPKETRKPEDSGEPHSLAHLPKAKAEKPAFRQPIGAALVLVPLRVADPNRSLDPRYIELALLLLVCLLIGTALGRNFFFLPLLMVFSTPTLLDAVHAGHTGFAWLFFCVMAWVVAPKRLLSGLLMGLACATHIATWFIAPFLLVLTARESGLKVMLGQLAILLLVFVGINGFWIKQSPSNWGKAVTHELRAPEKSLASVGLVYLEKQKLVPPLSEKLGPYWLLVGLVLVFFLVLLALFPEALYALGPVLGILPFWAFYRSDPSLFYFIPLLAMAGWASARIHPPEVRCTHAAHQDAN